MGQLGWVWFAGDAGEWDVVGDFGMTGPDGSVSTPPSGNSIFGYLSTVNAILGPPFVPLDGVTGEGTTTDGSTITSPLFVAEQGSSITLNLNFVTTDGSAFTDYAWVELLTESNIRQDVILVIRTNISKIVVPAQGAPASSGTITPAQPLSIIERFEENPETGTIELVGPIWSVLGINSGQCYRTGCGYTGWINVSYIVTNGNRYKLKIGVANWGDRVFETALGIDDIRVNGNLLTPPLPPLPSNPATP